MPTGKFSLSDIEERSQQTGRYRLSDIGAEPPSEPPPMVSPEPPGAVSRFFSGMGETLSGMNPINAIREYANRPSEIRKASKAMTAGLAMRAGRKTPENQEALETGMRANLGNTAVPPVIPSGAEPLVAAGVKAKSGDVAGAAGNLAGAAVPFAAAKGVQKSAPAVRNAMGISTPEKTYSRALSASKEWAKKLSPEISEELIKRRVAPRSLEALSARAKSEADVLGREIGAKWGEVAAAPKPAVMRAQPILDSLAKYKESFKVGGEAIDDAAVAAAARLEEKIQRIAAAEPKGVSSGEISLNTANRMRQILDKAVKKKEGFVLTDQQQPLVAAQRELTNSIRNELRKARPDIAKINEQYSFWKDVEQVADATIKRRHGQESQLGQSISRMSARGAGAVVGGITGGVAGGVAGGFLAGEAAAVLHRFVTSPGFRMMNAVARDRLAAQMARAPAEAIAYMSNALAGNQPSQQ